jgi:hypothetical protein
VGSFDRAVSSGSLALAADAVCYGISIGLLLLDRFTTAWKRYDWDVAFGIIWRRVSELFGARPDVKGMSCVWEATPVSSKL